MQDQYYKKYEETEISKREFEDIDDQRGMSQVSNSRYERKKEKFLKISFSMQDTQAEYHKQIGQTNRYWKKFNDYFPRFLEELQYNERMKYNVLEDTIANLIEYLYSYKGVGNVLDEGLLKNKLEHLKKHFDLSKILIVETLGEDECHGLKARFGEKFEGYEEYLIDREFWNDRNIAQLVKSLEKEAQEITPKDLSTNRKLVDYVFKTKDTLETKTEMASFDPYTFFSNNSNVRYFIHSLLLRRHKVKGSSFEISEKRFKLLLNSFQFICLSMLSIIFRFFEWKTRHSTAL